MLLKVTRFTPLAAIKANDGVLFLCNVVIQVVAEYPHKNLFIYLVYNNNLIYNNNYFWQRFAGRPRLILLFLNCHLFALSFRWCMGLSSSQPHTSRPVSHRKGSLCPSSEYLESLSSHMGFIRELFHSWSLVNVCFFHCLFRVIDYCNFFPLISVIPIRMLHGQCEGVMRHDVYSDAFGGNVHLKKKWTETKEHLLCILLNLPLSFLLP